MRGSLSKILTNIVLVGALDVKLTEEDVKYLEEPYKPLKVLGHA